MRLPTGPTSCKLSFATARADAQAHRQAVCTNGTLPLPGSTSAGEVGVLRVAVRCAPDPGRLCGRSSGASALVPT
ncbi:MAG: hypothetical protein QOK44_3713 [Betaproteobacteria bacterium]|nr:hypothetical protein [Betaproteobacteria bacterium]